MAGEKIIQKNFNAFRGKDSRSSDLIRDRNACIDLTNVVITKDSTLSTREGNKIRAPNGQFLGMHNYAYSDSTTGATEEETISISQNLYRRRSNTFTIAYSGASSPVVFNLKLDTTTATFKATILEGSSAVLNYDLGTGLEASPITLANFKTAVDAVTNFAATISGDTSVPAAFLPITLNSDLVSAPNTVVMTYYDWAQINSTTTNPFSTYYAARGGDDFEHCSFCNYQDVVLIATGYEYLYKYDGQTVYRVGVPASGSITAAASASAGVNVDAGTHTYICIYKQIDNRGNIAEGKSVSSSSIILGAAGDVDVTVGNLLAGTGFNTNCALVNGNQVGVTTITVTNSPHTMKIGDTAYFLDRSSGSYVTRTVTATAATTITISGAAVNVNNADVISNNLRIEIFRTKAGGVDYFLVAEIPNNSFAATQLYYDNQTDASLGAQYFIPARNHDVLSVKPKYVTAHDGVIVCAGDFNNPNTVYYSYDEDLESFPAASNSFDIASTISGGITGIISNQEVLAIGKKTSLFVLSGGLNDNSFRIEKITEGAIGIACHNSAADIGAGIIFLSQRGWFLLKGGFNPVEIGAPVNKVFYDAPVSTSDTLRLKRSFAVYDEGSQMYICFIPTESGSGTSKYVNGSAVAFVYDTYHDAWIDWTGLNMGGGICVSEETVWWQSKRDDATLTVTGNLFRKHNSTTEHDYADHTSVISLVFGPQWEDGQEPSQWKYIPRLRIYNLLQTNYPSAFTFTVRTELDYDRGNTDSQFTYPFGTATSSGGWGLFPWGSAWGSPFPQVPRPRKLRFSKFRALRFIFSHGALNQRATMTGYEYELIFSHRKEMTN